MIEWESLAVGLSATDALLKEAAVTPVVVRAITPGRFVALFAGEVEDVRSSMERGLQAGADCVRDHVFLPQPHPSLVPAVGARTGVRHVDAMGILEVDSTPSAIAAADAAAKEGVVRLSEIRLGMGIGGKGLVLLTGEVSQVDSALQAGSAIAESNGRLLRSVVIPRPDDRMAEYFVDPHDPFSDFVI